MRFGGRPGKSAGGRVDTRSFGRANQAEGQRVCRNVRVSRSRGKAEFRLLRNSLVANRAQNRSNIDFANCHGYRFTLGQSTVAHAHIKSVSSRALRFGGRPGKSAGGRVDTRSFGRANQAVGQCVPIHIRAHGGEAQLHAFVSALIANRRERWRVIDASDSNGHKRDVAVACAVIHPKAEAVRPNIIQCRGVGDVRSSAAKSTMRWLVDNFPGQTARVQVHRAQGNINSSVFRRANALRFGHRDIIKQNVHFSLVGVTVFVGHDPTEAVRPRQVAAIDF